MGSPTATRASATPRDKGSSTRRLDDLLSLDVPMLEALYRNARVPKISELTGDLRGRMLAWPRAPAPIGLALRTLAGSDLFPWRGKSFTAHSEIEGEGKNRVVSDAVRLFRFKTSIGRSRAGDFDAVQLDYDLPGNPRIVRAIRDEIREIDTGLQLGQAYLLVGGTAHLVLYFGLER
jgi:hypothetical protein